MKTCFEKAAVLIRQAGYTDIAGRLDQEQAALSAETYKIAVTGEFKTGKSTLVNRIFLKEDVLFADIMEATAVPAEITYGPEKLLETFPCDGAETVPVRILNPSPDEVRRHTSAETPEGRAILARNTDCVRICWPADNLEGLTLFDTPGINSINAAVIATTYRIIPRADLVLFLTTAKQLSAVEIEFLGSRVFGEGITRLMVVMTWDEEPAEAPEKRLVAAIRSQLAHIGRPDVPVISVNLRESTPDMPDAENFLDRIIKKGSGNPSCKKAVNDVIHNLLDEKTPEKISRKTVAAGSSWSALEQRIILFIRENVRPARDEKARKVLSGNIHQALARSAAELAIMQKSTAERHRIFDNLRAREAEIRLEHEKLSSGFRKDIRAIRLRFVQEADRGLGQMLESCLGGIDACESLGDVQERLGNARRFFGRDMEELFLKCTRQAEEAVRELVEDYGVKSRVLLDPWQAEISRELEIDGGLLSRIPPFAVLAADIMLFVRFGPFGPLADILIRLAVHYIPYLNKALPASVAAGMLKKKVRASLETEFGAIRAGLPEQAETVFGTLETALLAEWQGHMEKQLQAVRQSVETGLDQPVDVLRMEMLNRIQGELGILLAAGL